MTAVVAIRALKPVIAAMSLFERQQRVPDVRGIQPAVVPRNDF